MSSVYAAACETNLEKASLNFFSVGVCGESGLIVLLKAFQSNFRGGWVGPSHSIETKFENRSKNVLN